MPQSPDPVPLTARRGDPPIAASGRMFAIHEWTRPGPSCLHVHHSDDEGWHVLEGRLRFHLADRTFDAPAGTTVVLPAGTAHTCSCPVPSRYLIVLTPRLDRMISRLFALKNDSPIASDLFEHDTEIVGWIPEPGSRDGAA